MKKLILASLSGIALMGLAACSDTDDTTTQGLPTEQDSPTVQPEPMTPTQPAPAPAAPTE